MSQPSDWPLDHKSVRLVSPVVIRRILERHPLSRDCYPLAIGYYEKAYHHRMSRQRHDDNILIYCFAGRGHLETPLSRDTVTAGQLILLPSGIGHRYWSDTKDPWSIYWCHFSGTHAREYLAQLGPTDRASVIPIGQVPTLTAQFQTLLQATSNGFATVAMVHAANMLKQLLTGLAVIVMQSTNGKKSAFSVENIQAFMLQNLDKPLDLDNLAKQAGLSKFHFSKKYRQLTGHAPISHLIKMRMEYARYLIETSDSTIAEVATKVGHDDALYFSRQFKQAFGMSPQQLREASLARDRKGGPGSPTGILNP